MYDRNRIINEKPIIQWIVCLGLVGYGAYTYYTNPNNWKFSLIIGGIGLVFFLVNSILNVYVDKSRRVLEIERISILGRKRIEVQMDKIERVLVDRRVGEDSDGSKSTSYQVVLILDDGQRVPLRRSFSGSRRKQHQYADLIANEVGIDDVLRAPESIREAMEMAFSQVPLPDQEQSTGIAAGVQQSNGVSWQMDSFTFAGSAEAVPVYRWSSADLKTPGDFIFIVQKAEGQGQQKGLMKLAGKFLFKTSLQMYGFDESYAPGLDGAETVEDVDRRLVDAFFVYTSHPPYAKQILNPWMVAPLVSWSERYELHLSDKNIHQLAVLFSPQGLFVSRVGSLDQAEIDELVALGIELVKAG